MTINNRCGNCCDTKNNNLFSHDLGDYLNSIFSLLLLGIFYLTVSNYSFFNFKVSGYNFSNILTPLLIGIAAGFSTCFGMVGGLVLGISTRHRGLKTQIFFNLGRVIAFLILGGLIGLFGTIFQLSVPLLSLITLFIGIVMTFMGVQLTNLFPRLSKYQLTVPKKINRILNLEKKQNIFLIGALTFFLPCGFTQATQLYAVSTGSFFKGAETMGLFALGTIPGLLAIGSFTLLAKGNFAKIFFNFIGTVILVMGVLNIRNAYNLAGINLFTTEAKGANAIMENNKQIINMTQDESGYKPNYFIIKKNIPVVWIINSENNTSCASSIVSNELGIRKLLQPGKNTIEFTPKETGDITFSCSMGMYKGVFKVIN